MAEGDPPTLRGRSQHRGDRCRSRCSLRRGPRDPPPPLAPSGEQAVANAERQVEASKYGDGVRERRGWAGLVAIWRLERQERCGVPRGPPRGLCATSRATPGPWPQNRREVQRARHHAIRGGVTPSPPGPRTLRRRGATSSGPPADRRCRWLPTKLRAMSPRSSSRRCGGRSKRGLAPLYLAANGAEINEIAIVGAA